MRDFKKLWLLSVIVLLLLFISSCESGKKTVKPTDDNGEKDSDIIDSGDTDQENDETGDVPDDDEFDDFVPETCGDKIVDEGEVCDGNLIDCVEIDPVKYTSGKAKCLANCLGWDVSTCDIFPYECGNEIIESGEVCDSNVIDCVDIDPDKYDSGKAKCLNDCSGYNTATCSEKDPVDPCDPNHAKGSC